MRRCGSRTVKLQLLPGPRRSQERASAHAQQSDLRQVDNVVDRPGWIPDDPLNLYIASAADAYDRGGTERGIIVVAKWQSGIQRIPSPQLSQCGCGGPRVSPPHSQCHSLTATVSARGLKLVAGELGLTHLLLQIILQGRIALLSSWRTAFSPFLCLNLFKQTISRTV